MEVPGPCLLAATWLQSDVISTSYTDDSLQRHSTKLNFYDEHFEAGKFFCVRILYDFVKKLRKQCELFRRNPIIIIIISAKKRSRHTKRCSVIKGKNFFNNCKKVAVLILHFPSRKKQHNEKYIKKSVVISDVKMYPIFKCEENESYASQKDAMFIFLFGAGWEKWSNLSYSHVYIQWSPLIRHLSSSQKRAYPRKY